MTHLTAKTVWITGASSGIGEALAVAASRRGARIVLSARRAGELERVRQQCADPAQVAVLPLDLTDFDAPRANAQAAAFFGPVDVLVNNAGISQRSLMLDTDMSVYRRILELDFFATVALTKAVVPSMIARGGGHVVQISSVVGYVGTPLRTGYAAAKHAMQGFTEAAAAELWRQKVRFTIVCPGFIRTNVSLNAITGSGGAHGQMDAGQANGMDPDRCAELIWRGVEADREEVHVGREKAFTWLKRHFPAVARFAVRRAKVA
jgi:dehydrogenase/reductase SDR family member 7B